MYLLLESTRVLSCKFLIVTSGLDLLIASWINIRKLHLIVCNLKTDSKDVTCFIYNFPEE